MDRTIKNAGPEASLLGAAPNHREDPATDLATQLETTAHEPVWVRIGRLFDGLSEQILCDAHLVYDALRIRYVAPAERSPPADVIRPGQSGPDVHLSDYTALPGLIEAHAHLFLEGEPVDANVRKAYLTQPPDALLEQGRGRWPAILGCGVMAVRDAGDKDGVGLQLAAECAATRGQISTTGYIDSPGAAIHHQGRYASFMARPVEEFANPADCVADRVRRGADRIKLIATGIINFKAGRVTAPPQMSVDEVHAFVTAAQTHGKQSFAHASGAEGIENVIAGGVTTVEHGYFVTREQLAKMRDLGIGWVPTVAPVQVQIDRAEEIGWDGRIVENLQRVVDGHAEMIHLAHRMGVAVLSGSDAGSCGVPHGAGLLRELELMQQAGMSATAVMRSATGASAEMLRFSEPIGRLAPGFRTRVLFSRHDPLTEISHLLREKVVLLDGRVVASGSPRSAGQAAPGVP